MNPYRRYGFNFQWMFAWREGLAPGPADLPQLDFLQKHGFDYARIPTDYRFWTRDFDYSHPDESVFESIDGYLEALRERSLHMALNVHRAPGYCINRPEIETDNLWTDTVAQDAFVEIWERFARRYRGVSGDVLSFDLLNEPPNEGERGFTRDIHQRIMRRTVAAIRAIDPDRPIALNGLGGGHRAIPELADLGVIHSGRGYQPMTISHYHASWYAPAMSFPEPVYPGTIWEGKAWDKEAIREAYEPWREVERQGVAVHIGEFGCFTKTPNDVALRWLRDLFSLYKEFGWGYGMWNFDGPFGILEHGRPGANYEVIDGFRVDRDLLELMKESRTKR